MGGISTHPIDLTDRVIRSKLCQHKPLNHLKNLLWSRAVCCDIGVAHPEARLSIYLSALTEIGSEPPAIYQRAAPNI